MPHRTDPALPGLPVLPGGEQRRVVASYTRRGSRMHAGQQRAWDEYADSWLLPAEVVTREGFDQARWFGRRAPLAVEIGSGVGEALAALAAAYPAYDVLGLEVWRPGLASTFARLAKAGVTNARLLAVDAVWVLEHLVEPDGLAALWTFFPDPWPKLRHHKRRLVSPQFARLAASRLAPGAQWRLATDWEDYAGHIEDVLGAEPLLVGGRTPRWPARPLTKFERRGHDAGRTVVDFEYTRRGGR